MVEFRGNVQTRMRKLDEGEAAATFLAMAGLNRLGLAHVARAAIEPDEMLPAVGQGAIGVERRADDDATRGAARRARPTGPTAICVAAERAFLAALDGSCQTPIAGLAVLNGDNVHLRGLIVRPDGSQALTVERRGASGDAAALGADAGDELRRRAPAGFFADVG